MRRRFFLIVLDGCGVGEMPDAVSRYGASDAGSNTLGNVARAVKGLSLPFLESCGLGNVIPIDGVARRPDARSWWGKLSEVSDGKDTVTGHWEMMGVITDPGFPVFPYGFPQEIIETFETRIGAKTLGNMAASGTEILKALGEEHVRTGCPIVYTSADSVFQIAAHEDPEIFGLARLYAACDTARRLLVAPNHVCRVIARPFVGRTAADFVRTQRRKDYPLPPPHPTTLDALADAGLKLHMIGKVGELFPPISAQTVEATTSNADHCAALARAVRGEGMGADADFVFANLEDFDMLYGHRNDPDGFARLLVEFDRFLGSEFAPHLKQGDLVGITADHGNDPTTPSTDHSREYAPLLLLGAGIGAGRARGTIDGFSWWGKVVYGWLTRGMLP